MIRGILQKICICKIQVLLLCGIASTCISHISFADVKLDAELFAKSALIDGQALSAKTQASSVPGFKTDNPDATKYYSDSSTMETKSISAKAGDTSSTLIRDSYNKKKEFKDDALKTMLDSKSISSNPKRTIETIASQYNKCEDKTSANKQKYETKRCDEYISTNGTSTGGTSTGGTSCYIGNLIGLNSDTNYTCTKEKEVYKKVVTSNLNTSCKTKQSQFFETTYQNFQGFNVSGNTLYLGTNTGGSTLGQNCSGHNFSWKFKVDNLNDVKTLYWNSLILDDSIRVYVNGQSVWSWGNACELGARRGFNPNVDFKPYLKQGDNEIIFQVIVGGGGSFYSTLTWDYSKCTEFNETWNDDITRSLSVYDSTKTEECKQSKPEECSLSGQYTTSDGYIRNDACRSKKTEYSCTQNNFTDYCKTIAKVPACNKFESKCLIKDGDGECIKKEERYACGGLEYYQAKNNSVAINSPHSLIYGSISNSLRQCTIAENTNPEITQHCDLISSITGDKSCYLGSNVSDCTAYQNNSKCTLQETKCFNSDCSHKEKIYHCAIDDENTQNSSSLMCGDQSYCLDGDCAIGGTYEAGKSLPKVLTYLKTMEEAKKDSNKDSVDIKIFTGKGNKCEKDVLGTRNCCTDSLASFSNASLARDSANSGWGKGVGLGSCSYEEQNLGLQKEKGMCVYIGSYCSSEEKLTGLCLKKAESYCCFSSKLSRIIQEQGRNQIGLNLGTAETPNCSGLSPEQMQKLDFTKIDFTQYTSELTMQLNSPTSADVEAKIISEISGYDGK
jgi:hypothetical protein